MKHFIKCLILLLFIAMPARAEPATIGESAPDFTLTDTNGKAHSLSDYQGKTVILEWTNHLCPFVQKHYGSGNMQALQQDYQALSDMRASSEYRNQSAANLLYRFFLETHPEHALSPVQLNVFHRAQASLETL